MHGMQLPFFQLRHFIIPLDPKPAAGHIGQSKQMRHLALRRGDEKTILYPDQFTDVI